MKTEDQILIEKQLREGLSEDEKAIFLSKLAGDDAFRQEYELEKQLHENLNETDWNLIEDKDADAVREYTELFRSEESTELAALLTDIAAKRKDQQPAKGKSRQLIWYIGIAATLLIGIMTLVLLLSQGPETPSELYAVYMDLTEVPSLIERGSETDSMISEALGEAQSQFENGQYAQALVAFDRIIQQTGERSGTIMIYQGIALMETNQYDAANETFETLINSNSIDATKGYWYKALLLLKQEKTRESKALLEKISSENLYNAKRAKVLLQELNR